MRTLQKGRLYRLRIDMPSCACSTCMRMQHIMRMQHNMYLLNLILVYAMSVCLLALVATPPAFPPLFSSSIALAFPTGRGF